VPYDPYKDGLRNVTPRPAIPHVSFRSEDVPLAPPRKQPRIPPLIVIPWRQLAGITVLALLVGAVWLWLNRPSQEDVAAVQEEVVLFVTATPPSSLLQTATSVLPVEYILSLSQTPEASPIALPMPDSEVLPIPTVTPAFVALTPSFNLPQSHIVYVCYVDGSDEICLMNADGSNQQRLTYLSGTDWYPSLSPDGQTILFSSQRGNGPFDIYALSLPGGEIRRLTRDMGDNYAPEFSPDGTRIVFTSTYGGGMDHTDQNIWVMNADGSNPTQITFETSDDIDPSWSPDGTQISFASNRMGTKELFVMNADGSNVRQLTTAVSIGGRNDWSPDGRYLTFYAGPGSDKDIFIIPIECTLLVHGCDRSLIRRLTNGGSNKGPSFSPDGQWITFASSRDGDNEIMIMRIDGTEVTALTFNDYADWQPRWGP